MYRITTALLDHRINTIKRVAAAQGHPYADMERYSAYGMHALTYGNGKRVRDGLNTTREAYFMAGAILATLEAGGTK